MAIVVREARASDVEYIVELERSCFDAPSCEARKVHEERVKVFSPGFLIMEKDGDVVGMISSEIWDVKSEPDESFFTLGHSISELHSEDGNELYLSNFCVFPKYRGSGYGKILFNTLLSRIKISYPRLREAALIVSEDWGAARHIYSGRGFEIDRVIPEFFTANDGKHNGLVMKKTL